MDERSLFLAALEQPSPQERETWLRKACGDNNQLRERVALLLAAHEQSAAIDEPPISHSLLPTQALQADTSRIQNTGVALPVAASHTFLTGILQATTYPTSLGRVGTYEIMGVLGQGGMGVVLKGYEPKLNRHVAVKLLSPQLSAHLESRQRFLREAQAAAAVVHPNVVTIHAVDDGEPPYLVMELVQGESMQDRLDRDGPFPFAEIVRVAAQIAAGLTAAHARGLIHRDIKPANILIERETGRVKLTDFGLARAANDVGLTQTGFIVGTPLYMSPEQAQGKPIDQRSDLFSLGSVLYAMCTGQPPFAAETGFAVIRRVCDDEPTPIGDLNPHIAPGLIEVIERLLQKEPALRPASVAEVVSLLEEQIITLQRGASPAPFLRQRRSQPSPQAGRLRWLAGISGLVTLLICAWVMRSWWPSASPEIQPEPQPQIVEAPQLKPTVPIIPPGSKRPVPVEPSESEEPNLADAPFTVVDAERYQREWAEYLGVPVEFSNSLGMKFRLIPPGHFSSGTPWQDVLRLRDSLPVESTTWEARLNAETPEKPAFVAKAFYLAVHETTNAQYFRFVDETAHNAGYLLPRTEKDPAYTRPLWLSDFKQYGDDYPVGYVNQDDASAFCAWLSKKEGLNYGLPSELNWELACRAGTLGDYFCSVEKLDEYSSLFSPANVSRVGSRRPNPFGLFDMLGNREELVKPSRAGQVSMLRGGSSIKRLDILLQARCAARVVSRGGAFVAGPETQGQGFRVAIVNELGPVVAVAAEAKRKLAAKGKTPPVAESPFTIQQAKSHQEAWADHLGIPVQFTNRLGMIMRLVPPGKYEAGSGASEKEAAKSHTDPRYHGQIDAESSEKTITIAQPFYLGLYEVTNHQFQKFAIDTSFRTLSTAPEAPEHRYDVVPSLSVPRASGRNAPPFVVRGEKAPVRLLDPADATAFCNYLAELEHGDYGLPMAEQWEFAARAGAPTIWPAGDDEGQATYYLAHKHLLAVGTLQPNFFGFFDMLGNASELVSSAESDAPKLACGGSFGHPLWVLRPAARTLAVAESEKENPSPTSYLGLRVCLTGDLPAFFQRRAEELRP